MDLLNQVGKPVWVCFVRSRSIPTRVYL